MAYLAILPSDFALYQNIDKEPSRMKYKNAKTVFPKGLLDEIQKYAQGELVYIPISPLNHKKWGTNTKAKAYTAHRNDEITNAFKTGLTISDLAKEYYLSEETIKKIVYRKS